MDQRERHTQAVRNRSGPLRPAGIRTDDDRLLVVRDMVLDVLLQQRAPVEVVDGDVKEALVLRIVQIHGDDMVCPGAGEQVCYEGAGLGYPLLVAGAGLETIFWGFGSGGTRLFVLWGLSRGRGRIVFVMLGAIGKRGDGGVAISGGKGGEVAVGLCRIQGVTAFRRAIGIMCIA